MNDGRRQGVQLRDAARGFTLIEALIAIVVLAAASAGVLLIFANATASSADPQIRAQARAIAAAYMDEILLQSYADPDGSEQGCSGLEGESSRKGYDDVWDYASIGSQVPTDMFGNPISGLVGHAVNSVTPLWPVRQTRESSRPSSSSGKAWPDPGYAL